MPMKSNSTMKVKPGDSLTIQVTEDHIERGDRRSGMSCPISLAIAEQLNGWVNPAVRTRITFLTTPDGTVGSIRHSDSVARWILHYDGYLSFDALPEPITLELQPIQKPENEWVHPMEQVAWFMTIRPATENPENPAGKD